MLAARLFIFKKKVFIDLIHFSFFPFFFLVSTNSKLYNSLTKLISNSNIKKKMPKVFIIFYSLYHHVYTLAQHIQKGLESQGVEVELYQVKTMDLLQIIYIYIYTSMHTK